MPGVSARLGGLIALVAHRDDRGATSVEYALLATLIAVVVSGAVAVLGLNVAALFSQIAGAF
ncbi:MAG: Flp family type IVb pilin [Streptosporangiaceae bacterium]